MRLALARGLAVALVVILEPPAGMITSGAAPTATAGPAAASPTPRLRAATTVPAPTATRLPRTPTPVAPMATPVPPTGTPTPAPTAPAAASLTLSAATVAPGESLEAAGTGYGRREALDIWLTDPAGGVVPLLSQVTSPNGEVAFTFTLPGTGPTGRWTLVVQGKGSTRTGSVTFLVSGPLRPAPATATPPLAAPGPRSEQHPPLPVPSTSPDSAPTPPAGRQPAGTQTARPTDTPTPAATSTATPTPTPTSTATPARRTIDHLLPPKAPGGPLPEHLIHSYFGNAARVTGVPVEVLLAIAAVESRFTPTAQGPYLERFAGTEDEHALGMMQFLPSSYRPYAAMVDRITGKNLGMRGIWDPESAVYAAGFYLRDHGAPGNLDRAIYAYNHAEWYVRLVRAWAWYYANGGTLGRVPAGDLERIRQMADPTTVRATATGTARPTGSATPGAIQIAGTATATPDQGARGAGDQGERSSTSGMDLPGLLEVDLNPPSWPSYPKEERPQAR